MSNLKEKTFSSLELKIIGYVLSAIGAVAIAFFSGEDLQTLRLILEFISYPAIGIFTFLAVEGFLYTNNLEKYILSVIAAAIVTEPFYDYACLGVWFDLGNANGQNFLFALALCLIQLLFMRSIGLGNGTRIFMVICLVPATVIWAFVANVRFGVLAIILSAVFFLLRNKPKARDITAGAVGTVFNVTSGLSALLIHRYNEEREDYPKYLFYGLYPAIWMVLALIKYFA